MGSGLRKLLREGAKRKARSGAAERELADGVAWMCLMPTLVDSTWEYLHVTFKDVTNPFVLQA